MKKLFFLLKISIIIFAINIISCTSSVNDPNIYSGLLGDDYFGDTFMPDEADQAPPGLSLLNFKGGEYVRSGSVEEIRWILKPESQNDYGLFSSRIEYSNDGGNNWNQIPGAIRIPAMSGDVVKYNWKIPESSGGNKFLLKIIIKNAAGEEKYTTSNSAFTLDNDVPILVANSLVINGGAPIKKSYFKYSVSFQDSTSPVGDICTKVVNKLSAESVIPTDEDACWQKISEFSTPATRVDLKDLTYVIGFVPGDYVFRTWARDLAGNTSILTSGLGEEGVDKIEIDFKTPAQPIKFKKFVFANNTSVSLPITPSISDIQFTNANSKIDIQLNLDDNPISIKYSYSKDGGTTYTDFSNVGSCSVSTSFSSGTTGVLICAEIPFSSSTPFIVKVQAQSSQGMISSIVSPILNHSKVRYLAGNVDSGIGGSAISAGYKSAGTGLMVTNSKGKIFIYDKNKGLLMISPDDGTVKEYLKIDVSKAADNGEGLNVSQATTQGIFKIAVDFKDRLVLIERRIVRRIDVDGTISTLFGGGSGSEAVPFFPISSCPVKGNNEVTGIQELKDEKGNVIYPSYVGNESLYMDPKTGFIEERTYYRVNPNNGALILRNIDTQNIKKRLDTSYKIKTENMFYENEFKKIAINFGAGVTDCGWGRTPTLTILPNGDMIFDGFHARTTYLTRGNSTKLNYYAAGPNWIGYYQEKTKDKEAQIRLIPVKGTGAYTYSFGKNIASLNPTQTFESAIGVSNFQPSFNYKTQKLKNIHLRGCVINNYNCSIGLTINLNPKSASGVADGLQYIGETWDGYWQGRNLFNSKKGDLYSINGWWSRHGLYKYFESTNTFERILGTGVRGQCLDGTNAIDCPVDLQDAYVDQQDNIYFLDRDRIRVILKRSNNYKDSIVTTLFGFSKTDGDVNANDSSVGDSLAARFNTIRNVDVHSNGEYLQIHDNSEGVIRELAIKSSNSKPFKISTIAGNPYVTKIPTYTGTLESTLPATQSALTAGEYFADNYGQIYGRSGDHVFAKLNRTTGKWQVILGHPTASSYAKTHYNMDTTNCDTGVISPEMCDVRNRAFLSYGILKGAEFDETTSSPVDFLMFSSWVNWIPPNEGYQRPWQTVLKLIKTNVDGKDLVRNMTGSWSVGSSFLQYPNTDGVSIKNTSNFGLYMTTKPYYLEVLGNPFMAVARDKGIRYVEIQKDGGGRITSLNRMGTLIDGLSDNVRSYFVRYVNSTDSNSQFITECSGNKCSAGSFEAYVCFNNGSLKKYIFSNPMSSHTGSNLKATVLNTDINISLPAKMTCGGSGMDYNSVSRKLYFPFNFDGLMGVAEYDGL